MRSRAGLCILGEFVDGGGGVEGYVDFLSFSGRSLLLIVKRVCYI